MLKLKDRQKSIPNGLRFYLPEIKWHAPGNFPSFTRVCDGLQTAIEGNPFIAQKNKWPKDRKGVEDWVDLYNATLCARMGWDDYIVTDTATTIPKASPLHQRETLRSLAAAAAEAKELVAGAKSLTEWIDSGDPAVSAELSTHRAIICTSCPKNEAGDWTRWFTVPASELIRRQVAKAQARNLTTPRDELLHTCIACHCPLKLKVHVPIEWITKRLTDDQKAKLKEATACWILDESR
jgi:hypothetical protein